MSYPSVDHHPDEVGTEGEYPAEDYIPPEGDAPYGDDPEDAEYRARYRNDYGEGEEPLGGEDEDERRPWSEGDDEPGDEEGRGRRATWHEEDEHEAAQATETDEADYAAPKDPGTCLACDGHWRCTWQRQDARVPGHRTYTPAYSLAPSQYTYTRRRLP